MKVKILNISIICTFLFILFFIAGFFVFFDSPRRKQVSTLLCGTQLADIGKAMLIYTNDFNDTLPTSLNDLIAYTESTNPEQFICPTYGIKYKYIQGRSLADPPDTVLVYCPKEHLMSDSEFGGPSDKFGINVLFLASYVKVIDIYELNKLFLIQKIDDKIIK